MAYLIVFLAAVFLFSFVPGASSLKCYIDGANGVSTIDGCQYCGFVNVTQNQYAGQRETHYCLPSKVLTVQGHELTDVNKCTYKSFSTNVPVYHTDAFLAYMCDKDLCNDRCSAPGMTIVGIVIATAIAVTLISG